MDLDALLHHYLNGSAPEALDADALDRAIERIAIDLGQERVPGRRFALWALLHALGRAPDPERAFKSREEREAARAYAALAARAAGD